MQETFYMVITSGYAIKDDIGWDEPRVIYAGYNRGAAEVALELLQNIAEGLAKLGGKWFPVEGTDIAANYTIIPDEAFLLEVTDNTGRKWSAAVTENKEFELERDKQSFEDNGNMYNPKPTDFRPCANLRFYAVTNEHLNTILQVHKCGTPASDHKVVYFEPDEWTIRD